MNEVRIIGGKWKRRKLAFPNRPTLRPTPDRARVTLFNWLAAAIDGAHCLDLFAGSGALGFEALSRGAASATLIDTDPIVVKALRENAHRLDATACVIERASALAFLRGSHRAWDIVFLDPPFASALLTAALAELAVGPHLHAHSIVYVESSVDTAPNLERWETLKQTRTGAVASLLLKRIV
ncbi:MAG TPA: 16S rRNA (guanine(966)-N(2))-methyltransferase RsmD [Pseudomonadales bacterium]|nr:16S rRNA (guanine(966)-N(2))-methyltransferase RsmD [Pseudomonadales bacterium]